MATPVLVTGFEFDTVAGLNAGNANQRLVTSANIAGSPAIVADSANGGTDYCLELSSSGATENIAWDENTLGTGKRVAVFAFYLKLPGTRPAATTRLVKLETATQAFVFNYNPTGTKIEAQVVSGTIVSGPSLNADQWYLIQGRFNTSAATFTLDWSVDKVDQTQATGAGTAADLHAWTFGWNTSLTSTVRYDDFILSVTSGDYPLGRNKVVRLSPDADGTVAEIGTANSMRRYINNGPVAGGTVDGSFNSADILAAISDTPPTLGGSASGVTQFTQGTGNACGIPMTSYTLQPGESITGSRVEVCSWADIGAQTLANQFEVRAYNGTSETVLFAAGSYFGSNLASGLGPAWICDMYTGITSQATLDALVIRLGYSPDNGPLPGAHAVYTEVAILIGDAADITMSNSGSAADSLSVVSGAISKTLSDSGSESESISFNRTHMDTASAGDNLNVVVQTVPKTLSDSGSSAENLPTAASITLGESLIGGDGIGIDVGQSGVACGLYIFAITPMAEMGQESEGFPFTGNNESVTLFDNAVANDNLLVDATIQKTLIDSASACDGV